MQTQQSNNHSKIIIGSFPFRGQMQPIRLLLQYLNIPYQNKFFNPMQWTEYQKNQAKDWLYKEIPFFKCGNLIFTNALSAAEFIAQKYNRMDLLGVTQQQKIFMYTSLTFYNVILGAFQLQCQLKQVTPQQRKERRNKYWKDTFYPKFNKIDQLIHKPWFFSHLSILDFFISQDYMLFSLIYPQMKNLSKIKKIHQNVLNLPAIKIYQNTTSIKQICPIKYFRDFKEQLKKSISNKNEVNQLSASYYKTFEQKQNNQHKSGFTAYKKQGAMQDQK